MKVLTTAHVLDDRVCCVPGEVLELDNDVALDLLQRGLAIAVKEEIETPEANLPLGENEALKPRRKRGE